MTCSYTPLAFLVDFNSDIHSLETSNFGIRQQKILLLGCKVQYILSIRFDRAQKLNKTVLTHFRHFIPYAN